MKVMLLLLRLAFVCHQISHQVEPTTHQEELEQQENRILEEVIEHREPRPKEIELIEIRADIDVITINFVPATITNSLFSLYYY
jgi:hypothetical protein